MSSTSAKVIIAGSSKIYSELIDLGGYWRKIILIMPTSTCIGTNSDRMIYWIGSSKISRQRWISKDVDTMLNNVRRSLKCHQKRKCRCVRPAKVVIRNHLRSEVKV